MKITVYIEGNRLDLYDDETITIKSSVQNVNDISKVFADYSQTFTVPASKNNNQIFSFYYDADIDSGYDARLRKQASIDINTLDFKRGKMRLDSVTIKDNKPIDYKVTFFGDVIKIKDLIGNDKMFQLDWLSNFDHAYNAPNVLTGLTTGLDFTVGATTYEEAVIYPLVSYQRQYLYDSDATDSTSSPTLVNIAYNASRTDGVSYTELKPAIKLSLIVQAIEEKYGLSFTGGFFESTEFENIYMNLNKSTESLATGILEIENVTGTTVGETAASNDRLNYLMTINPAPGFMSTPYKMRLVVNGITVYESSSWLYGNNTKFGEIQVVPVEYDATATVITEGDFDFDASTKLQIVYPGSNNNIVYENNSHPGLSIVLTVTLSNELPDIKVYDLLTSLLKMFNLTVTPDGDDIYIKDLPTWYIEGSIIDVTPYVDVRTETVKRGRIFKEINFKFEESDQILADEYMQSNKEGYGDLEFKLVDSAGNVLDDVDGEELDVEVLFENPIFERLFDLNDNSETVIQYCPYFDREIKPISGNPFLLYAPSVSVAANPIGFSGTSYSQISTSIYMPSHSMQIDEQSFNLNFNAQLNEYTSGLFTDTIYDRYYSDYIEDMFSIKRRIYDYKAILPDHILNTLKLNDRLIIKDRRYIINSIVSNLTKREDSLELINDIYDAPLASDSLNTSLFTPTGKFYNSEARSDSTVYVGTTGATIAAVDTGYGTGWLTITESTTATSVQTINYSILINETGDSRTVQIQVTDGINDPKFTISQSTVFNPSFDFSDYRNSQNITLTIGLN